MLPVVSALVAASLTLGWGATKSLMGVDHVPVLDEIVFMPALLIAIGILGWPGQEELIVFVVGIATLLNGGLAYVVGLGLSRVLAATYNANGRD